MLSAAAPVFVRRKLILFGELADEVAGIANTHKRLQMYYGEKYGVSIAAKAGQGTLITIRIPRKNGC